MKKNQNKNQDEKLVDQILEKIRSGKVGQEEIEEKQASTDQTLNAKRIKMLRQRKEQVEQQKQFENESKVQASAKDFMEQMSEQEEKVFNEMMEAVNVETERQRVDNLVLYLKENRISIPDRLIVNLHYFPYLQKYYLLADAQMKKKKVNGTKLGRGYVKLLPKGSAAKAKISSIKVNLGNKKEKRKIKKKIAAQFYVDIESPTKEEKAAIENLLAVSPAFKKLYKKYQQIK